MFETPRQIGSAVVGHGSVAVGATPLAQPDLGKIGSALWRGRATILLTTIAALALAALFIVLAPREYTAATQILIDPTDLRAVGNETQPTQMSDAAAMQIESQVSVLTSDAVLGRVVDSEDLKHDPEFVRPPSFLTVLMGKNAVPGGRELAALNELKRRIKVTRDPRTFVVEVDVTSRDPYKAVRIANAVAQSYLTEQTQVRANAARQVSQSLSGRLQELKQKVRDAEEKAEDYKARNNLVTANGQLVTDQQLTDMNNQLAVAGARTADAKALLDQIEQVQRKRDDNGAFPAALQSPTIAALRSQYAEVMRREAEQTATLGALHPAVIDIKAQAERLHGMIDTEIDRAAAAARTDYETAKASEQTLTGNYATLKQTAMGNSQAMVGLRELDRDAQASRDIYQAFLVRAQETGAQEQVDTKNIRVLSRADLPQKRSSPPPSLLLALGALMFGAAAGTGIVMTRPAESVAPQPEGGGKLRRALAVIGLGPETAAGIPVLAVLPATDVAFGLEAADDPASPLAKSMRRVYDELRSGQSKAGNLSVLIVAADDKDEAATVALILAAVAATTRRVLLLDADLQRRTLSALDAEGGDAGLVDVAVGRRTLADAITIDRDTNIGLLAFVAPGSRRDRRVYDADIKRAFAQTRRYDLTVVSALDDADPSLRFFAGLVDHVLLVDDAATFQEATAERFVARLGIDADKVRGAVLTGAATA
ncbi:MAG: Wzz/FepE/Etk N-terminal domain-containing protein [Xanthobacteraceae bacterium]